MRKSTTRCSMFMYAGVQLASNLLPVLQTEELQKCMVSNKEYYAPVLEEGDSFAESKEKFDAASSGQSPQELKGESDSNDEEKEAPSESPAGTSPLHQPDNNSLHQTQYATA